MYPVAQDTASLCIRCREAESASYLELVESIRHLHARHCEPSARELEKRTGQQAGERLGPVRLVSVGRTTISAILYDQGPPRRRKVDVLFSVAYAISAEPSEVADLHEAWLRTRARTCPHRWEPVEITGSSGGAGPGTGSDVSAPPTRDDAGPVVDPQVVAIGRALVGHHRNGRPAAAVETWATLVVALAAGHDGSAAGHDGSAAGLGQLAKLVRFTGERWDVTAEMSIRVRTFAAAVRAATGHLATAIGELNVLVTEAGTVAPPGHATLLRARERLTGMFARSGDWIRAENNGHAVIESYRRTFGTRHHETVAARIRFGDLLASHPQGLPRAITDQLATLEDCTRLGPAYDNRACVLGVAAAGNLRRAGRFDEADTLLRRVVDQLRRGCDQGDRTALDAWAELLAVLVAGDRWAEAYSTAGKVLMDAEDPLEVGRRVLPALLPPPDVDPEPDVELEPGVEPEGVPDPAPGRLAGLRHLPGSRPDQMPIVAGLRAAVPSARAERAPGSGHTVPAGPEVGDMRVGDMRVGAADRPSGSGRQHPLSRLT